MSYSISYVRDSDNKTHSSSVRYETMAEAEMIALNRSREKPHLTYYVDNETIPYGKVRTVSRWKDGNEL